MKTVKSIAFKFKFRGSVKSFYFATKNNIPIKNKFSICLIVYLLFTTGSTAKDKTFSFEGEWFSNVMRQPKGFHARELYIYKSFNSKKFVLSQINFNESRKWEETRYTGKWEQTIENSENINLKAEECSVFASPELGKRWILIRAFDCDHLNFQLKAQTEKELSISPSMDFSTSEKFHRAYHDPKSIQSIVISTNPQNFTSWGIRLNKVKKNSVSFISKKFGGENIPVQISEVIDSSATHKTEKSVEIGDILVIKNRTTTGVFE